MSKFSLSVLRLRDFRLLVITRMCAVMALQAQAVIVGWQIYSITKDPFLLGLVGLTEALPAIFSALFAGSIVDRNNPHTVFKFSLMALALNTILLLTVAGGLTPLAHGNIVPWIYAGVFMSGLARSYIMPASFSMLPRIVQRADIPSASAWMSSGFQVAAISGPAIAGIVYGGYGATVAWMLPAILMTVGAFVSWFIKIHHTPRAAEFREPIFKAIRAGWAFIFSKPVLLSVMALDMFAVLFGGAVAMLPAFADQVLHIGSEGLGALRAAPALGAVCMAVFLAVKPMKTISAKRLLWAVTGFGACMIGFGLSREFWMAMLFLAFSGMFDSVSMVIRGTMMQWLTPDDMRGRVSAVNSMFIISSNEIGAFESGLAAKMLGLVPSIIIGGIGTLLVVAAIAGFSPNMRRTIIHPGEEPAK